MKGWNKQPSGGRLANGVSLLAQAHRGDHRQVDHGIVQVQGLKSLSSEGQGDGQARLSGGRSAKLHSTAERRVFCHKETDRCKDGLDGQERISLWLHGIGSFFSGIVSTHLF